MVYPNLSGCRRPGLRRSTSVRTGSSYSPTLPKVEDSTSDTTQNRKGGRGLRKRTEINEHDIVATKKPLNDILGDIDFVPPQCNNNNNNNNNKNKNKNNSVCTTLIESPVDLISFDSISSPTIRDSIKYSASSSTDSDTIARDDTNSVSHKADNTTKRKNIAGLQSRINLLEVALEKEVDREQHVKQMESLAESELEDEENEGGRAVNFAAKRRSQSSHRALYNTIGSFLDIIGVLLTLLSQVCDYDMKQSNHHVGSTFWTWWLDMRFLVTPDTINAFKTCYRFVHGIECTAKTLNVTSPTQRDLSLFAVFQSLSFPLIQLRTASSTFASQLSELGKGRNITKDCMQPIKQLRTLLEPLGRLIENEKWTKDLEAYALLLETSSPTSSRIEADSRSWQS